MPKEKPKNFYVLQRVKVSVVVAATPMLRPQILFPVMAEVGLAPSRALGMETQSKPFVTAVVLRTRVNGQYETPGQLQIFFLWTYASTSQQPPAAVMPVVDPVKPSQF